MGLAIGPALLVNLGTVIGCLAIAYTNITGADNAIVVEPRQIPPRLGISAPHFARDNVWFRWAIASRTKIKVELPHTFSIHG